MSLVDKQFGSKAENIYCGPCYDAQFATRCDGCGEIFRAGQSEGGDRGGERGAGKGWIIQYIPSLRAGQGDGIFRSLVLSLGDGL